MINVDRRICLRQRADADYLLSRLRELNLQIDPEALSYACKVLSDEWLTLWAGQSCNLSFDNRHVQGMGLLNWLELLQSLLELQNAHGIGEQIRRLNLISHERLDTALAVIVAGRYRVRGWSVAFERNGPGCSDLSLDGSRRFYVEVKRENTQVHKRVNAVQKCSNAVLGALPDALLTWLGSNDLRLEISFSRGFSFSLSLLQQLYNELAAAVVTIPIGEQSLASVPGGHFVLLRKDDEQFYRTGIVTGTITVKELGAPVQLTPKNMPVQVVFNWHPNLKAVGKKIREAKRQLARDARLDTGAEGFIVLEAGGGDKLLEAVMQRFFSSLPACCLGITLTAAPAFVVPRQALSAEVIEVMGYAAQSRFILGGMR